MLLSRGGKGAPSDERGYSDFGWIERTRSPRLPPRAPVSLACARPEDAGRGLGEVILLDAQDRSRWDGALIAEGVALVERALGAGPPGPYALQAAIAAVHAGAAGAADTDWAEIVGLYDVLLRADPSPVVALNRAAAVAMRDGPAAGLALVDAILARGELGDYQFAHSARADCCRRLGRVDEARASYERALSLARQEPERRFLERRLRELS